LLLVACCLIVVACDCCCSWLLRRADEWQAPLLVALAFALLTDRGVSEVPVLGPRALDTQEETGEEKRINPFAFIVCHLCRCSFLSVPFGSRVGGGSLPPSLPPLAARPVLLLSRDYRNNPNNPQEREEQPQPPAETASVPQDE
jgi:hypothetical protein